MCRTIILTNLLSVWVNLPEVGPAALLAPETQGGGTVLCGAARGGGTGRGRAPFWWGLE